MLTHVDSHNNPTMVDVTDKKHSMRSAVARTQIQLPQELKSHIKDDEIFLKKGPVFQTAIIAGTMATKRTHELIPFCHQIPVESCKIEISMNPDHLVTVTCKVKTTFKTGVEMEALHGSMTAALTVYDMCKAISHNIVIKETKLISKTGGKRPLLERPLYGLVLTGGRSERMKEDKALIQYRNRPHATYIFDILKKFCREVYLSSRKNQWLGTPLESYPTLFDGYNDLGPTGGILTALQKFPEANWIVVACDLVYFNEQAVEALLSNLDENSPATCYRNLQKGFPEPLCAIYTPSARAIFEEALKNNIRCPVSILKTSNLKLIDQEGVVNLANINTLEERQKVLQNEIHSN